ncbi:MAG: alanine racemase [Boseongicola sp.]|nr:alanine racemase [Boseongicola sp.]MYH58899.1 D-TA family PLP-dependent enzyme [Boseongicola sp. SB0675_bin_26]
MFPRLVEVETPALIIREEVALRNIDRFQRHCDDNGLKLRPHVKTHKCVHFAKAQIAAGATGITCQKIGEAEAMADGGIDDILIAYNILGDGKLGRLRALAERMKALTVVADNDVVVDGLSKTFETASRPLSVLVECDTGGHRCGVQSPERAIALSRRISALPGMRFGGLMTYPAIGGQHDVLDFMTLAKAGIEECGIACSEVSSGGSPDMWHARSHGGTITEYRAGTYIFNDRSLVERATCAWEDCAGRVVATVVSVPSEGRAIIDAGSKILTTDLLGLEGFGHVVGHPQARIAGLNEEHGTILCGPDDRFEVGEQVNIVPNHICVVINMLDNAWLERKTGGMSVLTIDARGKLC